MSMLAILAACMPCVESRFTPHPGLPRVYTAIVPEVNTVVERFTLRTKSYYATVLPSRTTSQLKTVLSLRRTVIGHPEPSGGSKQGLINRIYQSDRNIISIMHRKLGFEAHNRVKELLSRTIYHNRDGMKSVVETTTMRGDKLNLSLSSYQNFKCGNNISEACMDHVLSLMQHRADGICHDFDQTNLAVQQEMLDVEQENPIDDQPIPAMKKPRGRALYMPCNTWENGMLVEGAFQNMLAPYGVDALSIVHVVYVMDPPLTDSDSWGVLMIDLENRQAKSYFATEAAIESPGNLERVGECFNAVKTALNTIMPGKVKDNLVVSSVVPTPHEKYNFDQTDIAVCM